MESGDHSASELFSPAEQESHTINAENTAAEPRPVTEENHNENNTIATDAPEDCNSSHNIDNDGDNAAHAPVQVDGADETTPCNSCHN